MKNRNISHSDNWETPKELYNSLDAEFGFDFDPCPINCTDFDGLQIDWGKSNFVNPPYSQKLKEAFVRKRLRNQIKVNFVFYLFPLVQAPYCFTITFYLMLKKLGFFEVV